MKQPKPSFSFYDEEFPIYTRAGYLPPSKVLRSAVEDTMICDGCIIKSSRIVNSIVGIRMRLEENSIIENTLLMGADYSQSDADRIADQSKGKPVVGIGANALIRNAIVDKNARIGKNVQIINKNNLQKDEREKEGYWIRNGIVIVMKDAVIPDGTVI